MNSTRFVLAMRADAEDEPSEWDASEVYLAANRQTRFIEPIPG